MKKLIYFLVLGVPLYGQTGINTPNPVATLDITGKGVTSESEGVIAPRLSKQQLAAKIIGTYAVAQTGAIVYVNDVTTPTGITPSLAQVIGVTSIGYYYFDGIIWQKMGNIADTSIYTNNGTLTGNRVVTQGANTLTFQGTAANAFSVDGSTFSVDAANHRIGIGTNIPQRSLDVTAGNNPIRITNLPALTAAAGSTNILAIDATGDVRKIPFNNLLAGPVSLNLIVGNYSASGNESVIWNGGGAINVTLPIPSDDQVGKSVNLVASGGIVTLIGSTPTVTNGVKLTSIPTGNRITVFAIAKNVWGNATNEWVVIAKDF